MLLIDAVMRAVRGQGPNPDQGVSPRLLLGLALVLFCLILGLAVVLKLF